MDKLTIKDLQLKDKRVLMRVDFNVPLDINLNITDDTRIKSALPSITYVLDKGAKRLILMSHLGRPKGKIVDGLKMNPVAVRLQELLGIPVKKLDDCIGPEIERKIENAGEKVILLENLRFHPEEKKNGPEFSHALSKLGQVYINDAFGTAHRAHASTYGITKYLPSAAGFLIEKEIQYLGKLLKNPEKPFIAILGGAKVSDKMGILKNLTGRLQKIIIGGGMAYTFIKAQGNNIGSSKLENDSIPTAKSILNDKNIKVILPIDHIAAEKIDAEAPSRIIDGNNIPNGWIGLDIGPKTRELFKKELAEAKTIIWNGPLGMFELPQFMEGTSEIAEFITGLNAATVIGGGDTAAAIYKLGLAGRMTHVSTGGGASLEFLEGKTLPGITALTDKDQA